MPTRTLYKLTDENMRTYGGFQWKLGLKVKRNGRGSLCGPGWLHAYEHLLIAVLLSPIHVTYPKPRLFRAEGGGAFLDDYGLKCGVTELTLVEELTLPEVTVEQRVKFAILCALENYTHPVIEAWARAYLSGSDRSLESAEQLRSTYIRPYGGTCSSILRAAARAARYRESSTPIEEFVAMSQMNAAYQDAFARDAAFWAADAVEQAAHEAMCKLDLVKLAHQALEGK